MLRLVFSIAAVASVSLATGTDTTAGEAPVADTTTDEPLEANSVVIETTTGQPFTTEADVITAGAVAMDTGADEALSTESALAAILFEESTTSADPSEFATVVGVAPRCNATERAFWKDNAVFTREYQLISARSLGGSAGTTEGLVAAFGQHASRECFSCLGDATECGRSHCFFECLIYQQTPRCQTCINTHCRPTLIACTGAESLAELPAPPTQPLPTEPTTRHPLRTRPGPTTTTTTQSSSVEETETTSAAVETTLHQTEPEARVALQRRAQDREELMSMLSLLAALIFPVIAAFFAYRLQSGS